MGKKSKRPRAKQTGAIKPFVLFEQVWNQVTENGTIKDIDFVLRNENDLLRHLPSLEVTYPIRAARLYYILAMTIDYHHENHFPPKSDPLTYGHRYRVENCTTPQLENALSYIQKAFALTNEDATDRNKFNGYRTYLIDFCKRISREDVLRDLYQKSFAWGKFQEVDQEILVNYLKLKMQLDDYRGTIQIYNDNKEKIELLLVSERLLIYLIVAESHQSLNEYKKAIKLCEKRIKLLKEKIGA
jgi:tetratricopeptide (TPR) repeat protein